MKSTVACALLVLFLAACGSGKSPAATTETTPAAEPAAAAEPAKPTIGPDECCCPMASAEEVHFNISPRAECEAAGSECIEDERCLE
ncbi:MAG: hypothetical protein HS111_28515 [Kofleriaceae bacterium]|nr:hypothetical protein [Kofleriaceae bacterium]MCL4223585.1 hypothetical protein [Myxococcales bacterium]